MSGRLGTGLDLVDLAGYVLGMPRLQAEYQKNRRGVTPGNTGAGLA
jgi:hypothetical protein